MLGYTIEILIALQFTLLFFTLFIFAAVGLVLTTVKEMNEQFKVVKKLLERMDNK